MRSRIWAWMVTSRAVVGSSAMSSLGSHASAMAIITRWRSPPDSSWGYWSSRSAGRGISTRRSTSSGPLPGLLAGDVPVEAQPLGDLAADGHRRVEGRQRVLGDEGHLVTPHLAHLLLVEGGEVPAQQGHAAAGHVPVAGQQAHDGEAGGGLPAARLADDADALALGDVEGDAVDGHDRGVPKVELGPQVNHVEDRGHGGHPTRPRGILPGRAPRAPDPRAGPGPSGRRAGRGRRTSSAVDGREPVAEERRLVGGRRGSPCCARSSTPGSARPRPACAGPAPPWPGRRRRPPTRSGRPPRRPGRRWPAGPRRGVAARPTADAGRAGHPVPLLPVTLRPGRRAAGRRGRRR